MGRGVDLVCIQTGGGPSTDVHSDGRGPSSDVHSDGRGAFIRRAFRREGAFIRRAFRREGGLHQTCIQTGGGPSSDMYADGRGPSSDVHSDGRGAFIRHVCRREGAFIRRAFRREGGLHQTCIQTGGGPSSDMYADGREAFIRRAFRREGAFIRRAFRREGGLHPLNLHLSLILCGVILNPLLTYLCFLKEERLYLRVWAKNVFQTVPAEDIIVDLVGMIRGAQIDDFSLVTSKNEVKVFHVTFESLGGEMCVAIDWGDKTPLATYGDLGVCTSRFPWASHSNDVQPKLAMDLTHTYVAHGLYNVTLVACNSISYMGDDLMVIVTDQPCKPPRAEIVDSVLFFTDALEMTRGTDNFVVAKGSLDCGLTLHTKMRWQIANVSNVTGDLVAPVFVRERLSSWNLPILTIPARFLSYGYYQLIFTITMWDPANLDTRLPFQSQASTYIHIIESDLSAILLEGAVSHVYRGQDALISFEPTKHSQDPDFLDKRFVIVQWRCRRVGEDWPLPEEDFAKQVFVKGSLSTGCFGHGPGRLALDTPDLHLRGSDFLTPGNTYEVEATVAVGRRSAVGLAQVLVLVPPGPGITLRCAGDNLCRPFKDGVYLNPSYRAAVVSRCFFDCVEPLQYRWTVTDEAKIPFLLTEAHTPVGVVGAEFALSTQFYQDNPYVKVLHVSVLVTNGESRVGKYC
ncbi:uncharacterized protein [Panulirus ornatus]|uniref:uncharacterized protein n=1 Tax=Panulirus ornatus TaxID=150431 RepID=UPI003A841D91